MNIQVPVLKNGITTLATAGKYCERNIDLDVQVPQLLQVHTMVVDQDSTTDSAMAQWWLTDNDFVKNHYADPGFSVQIIPLQTYTEGYAISYSYHGNRALMNLGGKAIHGFQLNRTNTNSTNVQTISGDCVEGTSYLGIPYVKADGSVVSIHKGGNTTLRAGQYLVILAVAEA